MARPIMLIIFCAVVACDGDRSPERGGGDGSPSTLGAAEDRIVREDLEAGRQDPSWRRVVGLSPAAPGDSSASPESLEDIEPATLHEAPTHLPVAENMEGPSVLRVQVLLDRALFSPGIIDGRWGKNTDRFITISTESILESIEWRARLGAGWPFLSDEKRTVQKELEIQEYTDPDHDPMIPHTILLALALRIHRIYNGYWYFGRPTPEELRQDFREVSRQVRPDWDLSAPGLRERWERGEGESFWPYPS